MKRTLTIFNYIAITLTCLGCLFKIMHWPGSGPGMVLSFTFFSLFYMPAYYISKRKELNNWKTRFTTGLGIFCLSVFVLGILFKIMHWAGAGPLFLISMVFFSLIFLPLYTIHQCRQSENKIQKGMHITGGAALAFITLGVFFKIMHWPGAGILLVSGTFLILCAYLPLFAAANKNNSQNHSEKLVRLYFVIAIIGTVLTQNLNTISNMIIYSFCNVDERINEANKNTAMENNMLCSSLPDGAADDNSNSLSNKIKLIHHQSEDLYKYIAGLKAALYVHVEGMTYEKADSTKLINIGAKDNWDVPSHMLVGADPENPREGSGSARELKNKIIVFRKDLLAMVDDSSKTKINKLIGLSTSAVRDENAEGLVPWETYNFSYVPIVTTVTTLSQLQSEVLYSESAIINYLNNKNCKMPAASSK